MGMHCFGVLPTVQTAREILCSVHFYKRQCGEDPAVKRALVKRAPDVWLVHFVPASSLFLSSSPTVCTLSYGFLLSRLWPSMPRIVSRLLVILMLDFVVVRVEGRINFIST